PPIVVTSGELESRLRPLYQALHIPEGQLEALTGIVERRWWEAGFPLSQGAIAAARKALAAADIPARALAPCCTLASAASSSSRRPRAASRRAWASIPTRRCTTSATPVSAC